MSVLDDLTRVVTDTAKSVSKKSSSMVEVTRLSMAINTEEDRIQRQFYEIGKKVYTEYTLDKGWDEEIAEMCKSVQVMEKNIADMKTKILNLRKIKECPKCSEILDIDMMFCYKCGESQPIVATIVEETEVTCDNCTEATEVEVEVEVVEVTEEAAPEEANQADCCEQEHHQEG